MQPIPPPRTFCQKAIDGAVLTGLVVAAGAAAYIPNPELSAAVMSSAVHAFAVKGISVGDKFQHMVKPRTWLVIAGNLLCGGLGAGSMAIGGFRAFALASIFSMLGGLKITYIESDISKRATGPQDPMVEDAASETEVDHLSNDGESLDELVVHFEQNPQHIARIGS